MNSYGIKNNNIQEIGKDEADVEFISPSRMLGTHANLIPLMNNAQSPRTFYGTRFLNQALPLVNREAPLVQTLDTESQDGESFEHKFGSRLGARYFDEDEGEVTAVSPDEITVRLPDGSTKAVDLYNNFQFNRKTQINNKAVVKPGDKIKRGQILAGSNYTDDEGNIAMGVNARIGIVPYKGYSMDDAIVISQSFANKLASQHNYEHNIQKDDTNKMGRVHYTSLFPTKFTKEQLELLDDDGIVKPGTVLKKGDPIMLATKPKAVNSAEHLGKLGRMIGQLRNDAAEVWEHDYPGMVTDSFNGKKSAKVFISAEVPAKIGDKIIAGRNGQKDIISKIIPDEQMLRTVDGKPYEVLLNHLALPSRVNTATSMEIALGKLAQHLGKPIKVPSFNDPKKTRINDVIDQLSKAGLSDKEYAFDPKTNIKLERPIATGIGHVMKLHHVVESKKSARGNSSYNMDEQPLKGGSDGAQAKRLGGLEVTALISKGAYETLREGSTLRGAKNEAYWRLLRQGYKPADPGTPFVWDKFKILLNGAGMNTKDLGKGILRLAPMTDRDLEANKPIELENGKLVDPNSLEAIAGGLFDPKLVANNRWGKITLPHSLPNPAFEKQILQLLGITHANFQKVLAGEITLDEAQGK